MNENKKGVKAKKHRVAHIEPSKPRNFVAKNAINTGAGAHKDKKKAMKQGDAKHKKLDYAESLELRLYQQLNELKDTTKASYKEKAKKQIKELEPHAKSGEYRDIAQRAIDRRKKGLQRVGEEKVDEVLPALGALAGGALAGAAGAGRLATTAATAVGRSVGSAVNKLLPNDDENTEEEFDSPEYNDEAGMAHTNLTTLARAVEGLMKAIEDGDNLPEWCQEKIAKSEQMLVSVWDYILSQKEQGIDPEVSEGKKKGVDGKACWPGFRYAGREQKADGTFKDKCEKISPRKEDLEEKLGPNTPMATYIKDFEKSNAPQFRGKSKEKRRQMAIAAKMSSQRKGKKKVKEGWTHDSLASLLFDQELTYEDKLQNMLSEKLKKS